MPNANLVAARNQLRTLVSIYNSNFDQYQQATYNETQVRVDFVNPFFQLLGWDVLNEAGLPQHLREVTHEATVLVEENGAHRSKKPDYSFKVGTEILFFLETKKPSVNITADRAPSFQLRRYGWSGNLKVSVLTNFTDLFIYDCTVRPVEGDEIGTALIAHYHYTEYEDKFEEIYSLLSKESVLNGDFQRIFGNVRGAMRREPFDAYFLDQIRGWRNQLGSDVVRNNPNVDAVTLNIFVQRILNRSIFLRICEDKNLENYESLKRITTYQELKDLFAVADQKYDSGLFEMLDEDRLIISDAVIIDIFQSLYYPNNSYEFGVVDPYIDGEKEFDVIVGNPPFIRYQNFEEEYRKVAIELMKKHGFKPNRLMNIWLPFLVLACKALKPDGRVGMVIPAELFQVDYAAEARLFLSNYFESLTLVTFKKLVFDDIQQEVILLLGERNNFIAMRLTNADDQAVVKRLLPDSLGDYAEMLPILDIGEALIVGDASLLPSRIRIAPPKLKPRSATIDFWDEWAKETSAVNIRNAIEALRKQSK